MFVASIIRNRLCIIYEVSYHFFKNHFLLKIIFWLLRSMWLTGVHCILVLFHWKSFSGTRKSACLIEVPVLLLSIFVSQREESRKAGNVAWIFNNISTIMQQFSTLQPLATNNFPTLRYTALVDTCIKILKVDTKTVSINKFK